MIVSNTTPLSCLLKIGKADLLEGLYGRVTIPKAVASELDLGLVAHGDWRSSLPFVQEMDPSRDGVLRLLEAEVDAGEAAAIALASQTSSDLPVPAITPSPSPDSASVRPCRPWVGACSRTGATSAQ